MAVNRDRKKEIERERKRKREVMEGGRFSQKYWER